MFGLVVLAFIAVGAFALVGHGHHNRREVTGRSGTKWLTEGENVDSRTVRTRVLTPKGEPVLIFRQTTSEGFPPQAVGTRTIEFQAPSSLAAVAVKDFIG